MARNYTDALLAGLIESPFTGLVSFMSGIGVSVLAAVSGMSGITVSGAVVVPTSAILTIFTASGVVLGLAHGIVQAFKEQDARDSK